MSLFLEDPQFIEALTSIAESENKSFDEVKKDAIAYLKELSTEHHDIISPLGLQFTDTFMLRGYEDAIDVNPKEINNLAKIMREHPVAFVMTHKTYIDMVVLALVLARHGLPLPYTFAGINMAFPGVAQLGRGNGVIFIRRSFKDNHTYKTVLRSYISELVAQRESFMWAIEGTRSRTGKLVWPKMGILKYIAEAEKDTNTEVKYIPVSVVYDLISDVKEMTLEGRGKKKKKESLSWFVDYIRKMDKDMGKISLRFGDPVTVQKDLQAELPDDFDRAVSADYKLPKLAFELIYHINQITPLTTTSLICIVLLSKYSLNKASIESDVIALMKFIEIHKPDVLVDRGKGIGDSVQQGLNLLTKSSLIKQLGSGSKCKYSIVSENFLQATYYANMAVQHLYCGSFIELALLKVAGVSGKSRTKAFWDEIMVLRDTFKFEFFYSNKASFSDEIEQDFEYMDKDWKKTLKGTKAGIMELLDRQDILVSQVTLFTYIEAYRVVAYALSTLEPKTEYHDNEILMSAIFLGEEMHWQGKIHRMESVSKPFLNNGIRLARNLDLIPTLKNKKQKAIKAFAKQMEELTLRIRILQDITLNNQKRASKKVPLERKVVPGSKTETVTQEVLVGEAGAHIGAFFDLDKSLISGFSAKEFFQKRLKSGKMKPREIAAQFGGVLIYATRNKNFASLAAIGAKGVKGVKERVFIEVGEQVYMEKLSKDIYPEARALVDAHLEQGHTVAIISAATPYQVDPIARDLGIDHVLCTRMKVKNGKFTGKIIEPACWGEGKAIAGRKLAEEFNLDLSKSHFYTDSIEDLPLLEIVGNPHPLNPDNELAALAYQNDWPILRFSEPKSSMIQDMARTGLAAASLAPSAIKAAIKGFVSSSADDGVNSLIESVGTLGTKMAGIKLAVKGKKNLEKRPAIFLFNHQSNADLFIVAKLLKRDVVAIGKKEIEKMPIGFIFKKAGMIFIDRTDKEKAISAMQPAVEVLKSGKSIALAPEGTRSYDYKLGSFKKGAFHLALQAKVPLIPIVIQNAHDVMPRGKALLSPSVVNVTILPPVSTKKWKLKNLNKHVEEVRKLFLNELGQSELKVVHNKKSKIKP